MKIATSKTRLQEYLDMKGISQSEFYRSTGLNRGLIDTDKLHQSLSSDKIAIIVGVYSDLNVEWLITGKGPMLLSAVRWNKDFFTGLDPNNRAVQLASAKDLNDSAKAFGIEINELFDFIQSHFSDFDPESPYLRQLLKAFPDTSGPWLRYGIGKRTDNLNDLIAKIMYADALKEQLAKKDEQIKEKDNQIREKDNQIRAKDNQIQELQSKLGKLIEELLMHNEQDKAGK